MKKLLLLLVLNLIISVTVFSQGEFILEINRTDGTYTKVSDSISGVTWIYPGVSTYNENTSTYIFPSSLEEHRLYSINVTDSSIVFNPLLNNNLNKLEFDNQLNTLYGLEQVNAENCKFFVSINLDDATFTRIGDTIPGSALYQGYSTTDEINNRYIFYDSPNLLYLIDESTGKIVTSPSLITTPGEVFLTFEFDNTNGVLYGLLMDNNLSKFFVASIDTTDGTYTKIGAGTEFGAGNCDAAIDEANQEFMYLYSNGTGGYEIASLDIATGNLLSHAIMQGDSLDNFYNLEFDNTTGKLYAMHWDWEITVSIKEQSNITNSFNVYPNPSSQYVTIEGRDLKTKEIKIFNSLGQDLTNSVFIQNQGNDKIQIDLSNLNFGLYYIEVGNNTYKVIKSLNK